MSKRTSTDKSRLIEKAKKRYIEETAIHKFAYIIRLLGKYDVVIPFVCKKCGTCCKIVGTNWTDPDIYLVAKYLEMDVKDFVKTYLGEITNEDWGGYLVYHFDKSKLAPCSLLKDNKCSIYPVRPIACYLFPIGSDFGGAPIECPAKERVMLLAKKLGQNVPHFLTTTLSQFREFPSEKQWKRVLEKYMKTRPSKEEFELFFKYNKADI